MGSGGPLRPRPCPVDHHSVTLSNFNPDVRGPLHPYRDRLFHSYFILPCSDDLAPLQTSQDPVPAGKRVPRLAHSQPPFLPAPMTGPFHPPSPSPGHQTSGRDCEDHLPHIMGQAENEHGSTSSLLGASSGGECHEAGSIYARQAAQEKGVPAEDEESSIRASLLDTQAASDGEKQARAVSIPTISSDYWMTPRPTLPAIGITRSRPPPVHFPFVDAIALSPFGRQDPCSLVALLLHKELCRHH